MVLPWDLDLTWADNMFASGCGGIDDLYYPVLGDGRSAKLGWHMQDYNPAGAAGNAAAARPEHGRALLQAAASALATLLQELSALPLATVAGKPDK